MYAYAISVLIVDKCPMYITKGNMFDLIPCDLQYGACSDKDYRSNEVFKCK